VKKAVEGYRLSPQQRQLWPLQRSTPGYRAQLAVRLRGDLEPERLRTVLEGIVARHEILRTTFHSAPGIKLPVQVVGDGTPLDWSCGELGDDAEVAATLSREGRHFFDLERGPVLRAVLLEGADEAALILTLPALCCDLPSLRRLLDELVAGYGGEAPAGGGEEPVQYLHYSEWQQEVLAEAGEQVGDPWHRPEGWPPPPQPPHRRARRRPGRFAPETVTALLPEAVTEALGGEGAESFLLAAWQLLHGRLSGTDELAVEVTTDGRSHDELATAIGPFAKALPIVGRIDGGTRFERLDERTARALATARRWQDRFDPDRERPWSGPHGVEGVGFELRSWPAGGEAGGVSFEVEEQSVVGGRFQLRLVVSRRPGAERSELSFDPELFETAAAEEILERFHRLAADAAAHPRRAAGRLSLLREAEHRRLRAGLATGEPPDPGSRPVHELFAARAAEAGDRPAVVGTEAPLTAAELDDRANRLAHRLRALGVGPEVPVALYLEREPAAVVALLAVLKAGGAYLPLDTAQPPARAAHMLRAASPRVVVSRDALLARLPEHGRPTLSLDAEPAAGEEEGREPGVPVALSNLAYVLFTSGSTGHPKGVGVEHRQLLHYLAAARRRLGLEPGMSYAAVSTLAADLGHTMIFSALAGGGCLHLLPEALATDPEALAGYFARHPVDCLKIVPGHLRALAAVADLAAVLPRRILVLGGEALPRELVRRIRAAAPELAIFNHYGPTETTVGATAGRAGEPPAGEPPTGEPPAGEPPAGTVPLGRPLDHARVFVVDRRLELVPVGASGELAIGGAGVARGYLDAAATAAAFVPDPFGDDPGGRLYRSGDRVRLGADAELDFLGRVDFQINRQGFRIEPGEVEAALAEHPAVVESVVLARSVSGEPRLVAYLVAERGARPTVDELRDFLGQRLPEYMVPAFFVPLDALPLTANGKLDRAALPEPELDRSALAGVFVAPRSPVEEILAAIWTEVLAVDRIGIDDNFFSLGGDSMLSVRAVALAKERGLELAIQDVFRHPTIRDLAGTVEATLGLPTADEEPAGGDRPDAEELAALVESVGELPADEVRRRLQELTAPAANGAEEDPS